MGGTALASPFNGNAGMDMMNGNGMSNMMGEGMEEMFEACQNFMSSYGETDDTQK